MKLALALSILIGSSVTTTEAFVPSAFIGRTPSSSYSSSLILQQSSASTSSSSSAAAAAAQDEVTRKSKKAERLRFMKSDQFHRQGFKEVREKVESTMGEQFESTLVKDLKSSNYVVERDGVRVHLAKVRQRESV
jgi:hypothetical protein